jgi:hypothetical protein
MSVILTYINLPGRIVKKKMGLEHEHSVLQDRMPFSRPTRGTHASLVDDSPRGRQRSVEFVVRLRRQ